MAQWQDTRPGRPEGNYYVAGIEFVNGEALTGTVNPSVRALFAALGIHESPAPPADTEAPETVTEAPKTGTKATPRKSRSVK